MSSRIWHSRKLEKNQHSLILLKQKHFTILSTCLKIMCNGSVVIDTFILVFSLHAWCRPAIKKGCHSKVPPFWRYKVWVRVGISVRVRVRFSGTAPFRMVALRNGGLELHNCLCSYNYSKLRELSIAYQQIEHLKACLEIATSRTINWQQFCQRDEGLLEVVLWSFTCWYCSWWWFDGQGIGLRIKSL